MRAGFPVDVPYVPAHSLMADVQLLGCLFQAARRCEDTRDACLGGRRRVASFTASTRASGSEMKTVDIPKDPSPSSANFSGATRRRNGRFIEGRATVMTPPGAEPFSRCRAHAVVQKRSELASIFPRGGDEPIGGNRQAVLQRNDGSGCLIREDHATETVHDEDAVLRIRPGRRRGWRECARDVRVAR